MAANTRVLVVMVTVTAAMLLGIASGADRPDIFPALQQSCRTNRTAIFAHPKQCQLFYNCSNDQEPYYISLFHQYLQECPYPQLFSTVSLQCEPFDQVDCGDRVEHVDYCDYIDSFCIRCKSCWMTKPSCRDLPDGNHVFLPWLHDTELYKVCRSDRNVGTGVCPTHPLLNVRQYFNAAERRCMPRN